MLSSNNKAKASPQQFSSFSPSTNEKEETRSVLGERKTEKHAQEAKNFTRNLLNSS